MKARLDSGIVSLSPWIVLLVTVVLIAFKIWYKSSVGIYSSTRRLEGRTALVTGANTGIGLETAKDLARRGARVLLACRDPKRGLRALEKVRQVASGMASVELLSLDLASLASVRACAKRVLDKEQHLDILINNAGAWGLGSLQSRDGLHLGLQVNHFGPFLFTLLLIELLKKSAPARIVFVSSVMHHYSVQLTPFSLDYETAKDLSNFQIYNASKLANVLIANEFARRLRGTGVTSNSLHPGMVFTEIHRSYPRVLYYLMSLVLMLLFKSAEEGAQTTIYAAVAPELETVSGRYFADCEDAPMSDQARKEKLAKAIWNKSEELLSLKIDELPNI